MKLKAFHLFIILIGALLLSSVLGNIHEGMTNSSKNEKKDNKIIEGIPRTEIPNGDEDLYILKSQVVPPVCPACPAVVACPKEKTCPPCRPCGRCPEPSFECKKVPNYSAGMKNEYLPRPILSDFSQFGM
jgi:hypothetical protein